MKKRVLAVVTNNSKCLINSKATGLWLSELVHFYDVLINKGYSIDIISPQGGSAPLDPRSLSPLFLDKLTKKYYRDEGFMTKLENTLTPAKVSFKNYGGIFFTGGHGTLWDIPDNTELQQLSRDIYENGGIIAAVCHGVSGILNVKLSNGTYLLKNKFVTGYSNLEESLVKMKDYIPFSLQDELEKRGAKYKKASLPLSSFSITNGRLVTGQNPRSTKAVAALALQLLSSDAAAPVTSIY